ncbi:MAG: hypothetical protein GY711_14495 [bacterium]|nr:hypothetical protein [bacterium]
MTESSKVDVAEAGLAEPAFPWEQPISARRRLAYALLAWGMLLLSQPGLGRPQGFGHWAFVALAPWALACSRPGKRAFRVEWLAATVGLCGFAFWMRHLFLWVVFPMGAVPALYLAGAGVLLRRLARRYPLALAVPLAWMPAELVRWHLNAPLSFGWWRVGTMAHDSVWMRGSARLWGVWGLTYVFAAFGGWCADLWRARKLPVGTPWPHAQRTIHLAGLLPLAAAIALSIVLTPPVTQPGPRVLVVQPGIEQEVKAFTKDGFREVFVPMVSLTVEGLAAATGEPPDLVVWGETMYPWPVLGEGVAQAWDDGVRPIGYARWTPDDDYFERALDLEAAMIGGLIFARPGALRGFPWDFGPDRVPLIQRLAAVGEPWAGAAVRGERWLPEGTSFLSGVNHVVVHDGHLRRQNVVGLWNARGEKVGLGGKVHLVPGAEDPRGFQHLDWLMDVMEDEGGYVPDFLSVEEAAVVPLETRAGGRFSVGLSICYDNAFDDPYTAPLRREPVDFYVVASNESWYRRSVEMDHMVAFTKLLAVATGRTIVRATNSGISTVVDADGYEIARLEVDGEAKIVRGTLLAEVPVPVRGSDGTAPTTLYVRTERFQLVLWWVVIVAAALCARKNGNQRPEAR